MFYRVTAVIVTGKHPASIPNLEVKPVNADGTALDTRWESKKPQNTH